MKILVTGGAGYIGSAFCHAAEHEIVVFDNLYKGKKELLPEGVKFVQVDLADAKALAEVFEDFDAVVHFAAYKCAPESMDKPELYSDNIKGTINLLNEMVRHKVKRIVFSSSAAVYGMGDGVVSEDSPVAPINYYGYTKLAGEQLIEWYAKTQGIEYVSLRYFNVAGDAGLKYIDPDAQNVFPILMEAIKGRTFSILGTDYDTPDGTCIRDYIDINDLVDAHILALGKGSGVINLGTSKGLSVRELVDLVKKVTGKDFKVVEGPRRAGDPAKLVASNARAREVLGWQPRRDVEEMVKTTFDAYFL